MARSIVRTFLASGAAALLMASAGACSCSVGSSSHAVSKSDVAGQISAKMTDAAGNKPESVSCPGDLPATVGSELNCEMTIKGATYHVNVKVTSVEGKDVKFDMVETVDKAQIAQQISAKMTDAAGNKPDTVNCPGDLLGKVGSQLNCEMKAKGATYNVNVTVTSVNGSNVLFDMVETVDKNQVAATISDKLTEQVGRKPDSVTCPDNLKGVEGATLRCQLADGTQHFGVNVTVTDVDAGTVNFNIQVDDQPS
jgi:predicted thioesterase